MRFLQARLLTALLLFSFASFVQAQKSITTITQTILLGETRVKINVYQKSGSRITFVAPHYNEQLGRTITKEAIAKSGGRLIEIESLDENNQPLRRVRFNLNGKSYSVDPNRVFTRNGRLCGNVPAEVEAVVEKFANNFLKIVFASGNFKLRSGERFLVAVHNNGDVDEKSLSEKENDLTALAFAKHNQLSTQSHGAFHEQAAGVYLSNSEDDSDNFYFLSATTFVGYFAQKGFNVVVQKPAEQLQNTDCNVDDGSLSVFAAQHNIPYINIEADTQTGNVRQKQMIAAVYELLQQTSQIEVKFTYSRKRK